MAFASSGTTACNQISLKFFVQKMILSQNLKQSNECHKPLITSFALLFFALLDLPNMLN